MGGAKIDVEELMGSRGRIRVLRVLAEAREMNISEVGRRTGMNYTSVQRHLEALRGLGLLREKRYGKIRIYEATFNSLTVRFERDRGIKIDVDPPSHYNDP